MARTKAYWVYILTNRKKTVLYTGITSDLLRRIVEHKNPSSRRGFTSRYNVDILVFFEIHATAYEAIRREKQIKAGPRKRKVALIDSMNPGWNDLTGRVIEYYMG